MTTAAASSDARFARDHNVQFYQDQSILLARLEGLVRDGLHAGHGLLILATSDKFASLRARFEEGAWSTAVDIGQLVLVDAEDVLRRVLKDGALDPTAFATVIATEVDRLLQRFGSLSAYGELVDLLWERGHREATLAVEKLWHDLMATRPMTLLCGYRLGGFAGEDERGFRLVCDAHSHVHASAPPPSAVGDHGRMLATIERRGLAIDHERERREMAEAALRRSEEFNRRIIDSSGDCIKVIGLDGSLQSMNEGGLRAMGVCDVATIVGRQYMDFWSGPARDQALQALDAARAGKVGRFQGSCPTMSGEPRWWDVLVTPMPDAQGHIDRLLAVSRDITSQHEQSQRLLQTEQRLAAALAAARVGTWSWDIVADHLVWDVSLRRVVGLTDDEPLPAGKDFAEWIHVDDRELTSTAIGDALAGRRPYEVEFRLRHSDGSWHWHHSRGKVTSVDGKPVAMIGACVDVTELRQAQDAIAATADQLQRSNTELEQFAYIASHDLQEPLRMVTQYLDLLERHLVGKIDAREQTYLQRALQGGSRMHALIGDLLQYSRLGRDSAVEMRDVDLGRVFAEVVDTLAPRIVQAGATVTHDALPTVRSDKVQLTQVLQNLVSNALTFRGQDATRVHVSAVDRGDAWVVSVRDNGIGIETRHHQRIFEVFQRLHSVQQYPGTGIGLSICKKVVERLGGRIWVESAIGHGATFHFSLPNAAIAESHATPSEVMTGGHQRRDETRSPSTRGIPDAAAADRQAPAVVRAEQP
ncbi:MAG: PAS domain-containing protein [Planctomycetes bacterium]|nr:PAS domain-containing protein [Planctomycetota bacterium]